MRISDVTASVAHRWVDAWVSGDLDVVRALLKEDVAVEHNLGLPAERAVLLDTVRALSAALVEVPVLSLTTTGRRAAVLYDCQVRQPAGAFRLAEFLDIAAEQIVGIRRVYDLTAVDRLLPQLRGPAESGPPR